MRRPRGHAVAWSLAVLAAVTATVSLGAAPAGAGGSCFHRASTAAGVQVRLRDQCFGPTVLYARPGQTITWTNEDQQDHTVTGLGFAWGSEGDLRPGGSIAYRFTAPGVYPYTCIIHPGMVGAVVVGDAGRPTSATAAPEAALAPRASSRAEPDAQRVARTAPWSNAWRGVALAALAALFVVASALALRALGRGRAPRRFARATR